MIDEYETICKHRVSFIAARLLARKVDTARRTRATTMSCARWVLMERLSYWNRWMNVRSVTVATIVASQEITTTLHLVTLVTGVTKAWIHLHLATTTLALEVRK